MGKLSGKLALITGATRGIGAAVAKRYAAEGADIIAAGRSQEGLEALDDELRAAGYDRAMLVPFDVTRPEPAIELSNLIHEKFGKLDILVANAGELGTLMPVSHMAYEEFDRILQTNLHAVQYQLYAFQDLLRASPAGRLIGVSSGAALSNMSFWGPYSIAKAGMEFMLRTFARETEGMNLRANILDPGRVRTDMRKAAVPGEDPMTLPPAEAITGTFVKLAADDLEAHGERFMAEIEGWEPVTGDEGRWTKQANGTYIAG